MHHTILDRSRRVCKFGARFLIAISAIPLIGNAQAAENAWFEIARTSITTDELSSHVHFLADDTLEGREAGSRGGHAAAKYLVDYLQKSELSPAGTNGSFVQLFRGSSQNILAILPGSDPQLKNEYLLIGAHYDHVGYGNRHNSYGPFGFIHNGADDNASGVSALLELVDALTRTAHRPRRSILIAFWDGEEKGLLGSAHWIKQPTVPRSAVKLCVNVDMVGRLTDGRIEVGGTRSGAGLRRLLSSSQLTSAWLDFNWEYKNNSDHWTFYQARIPSIYVHTGLHDDYHRPSDDVEKINVSGIQRVTGYLLEQVETLADTEVLPDFRAGAWLDNSDSKRRLEQPLPTLASRLSFTWKSSAADPHRVEVGQVLVADSPLRQGDEIVAVNEQPIANGQDLESIAIGSDNSLRLTVKRTGNDEPLVVEVPLQGSPVRLGLSWREDTAEPQTVFITRVVPHSPAARAGFELGDRITALEGESFADRQELLDRVQALLAEAAKSIQFDVESRGVLHPITVPLSPAAVPSSDTTL